MIELLSGSGLMCSLADNTENVVGIIPELEAGETKRFSVESKAKVQDIEFINVAIQVGLASASTTSLLPSSFPIPSLSVGEFNHHCC